MSGQLANLLPIAVMLAAVWFLLIRPQQQRSKAQAEMLSKLEPGAEIVTIGGIFGTLVEVGEERLLIEVHDGTQIEIARPAVRTIVTPAPDELDEAAELDEDDDDDSADELPAAEETAGDE
jgi:preprotein translocase subunit YajC